MSRVVSTLSIKLILIYLNNHTLTYILSPAALHSDAVGDFFWGPLHPHAGGHTEGGGDGGEDGDGDVDDFLPKFVLVHGSVSFS